MKQVLIHYAMLIMMFSPVLIGYCDRPAPPPSRYGFTFKIDAKSLPKGVAVREVRNESSLRYFIKNTSDVPLIINERFLQNDQLASGAKLVSGRVLHYFPSGVPMQGKRHLKGWQAPFGEVTETLLYIKEPKKIYEGRKVGLTKELPKPEKMSIPANLGGKPYEIKGTIKYHLNKAYDVFHHIKNPKSK